MVCADDSQYATRRGGYLARTTELRKVEGTAVAYSERGYSHRGIAQQMDSTVSTVRKYLGQAMARYGLEICETIVASEEQAPDYEPVEPGYHRTRTPRDQQIWLDHVRRHEGALPAEWVAAVDKAAREDGLRVDASDG